MVFLPLLCTSAAGAATVPDAPPAASVYRGSTKTLAARMPVCDRYKQTGFFALRVFLGSAFTPGLYGVVYHYTLSGVAHVRQACFEVLPGHAEGAVVSLYPYLRPQASFIVQLCESGNRFFGRNPSV